MSTTSLAIKYFVGGAGEADGLSDTDEDFHLNPNDTKCHHLYSKRNPTHNFFLGKHEVIGSFVRFVSGIFKIIYKSFNPSWLVTHLFV